jgi:hypothetical protein
VTSTEAAIQIQLADLEADIDRAMRFAADCDAKGRKANIKSWIAASERLFARAERLDAEAAVLRRQLRIAAETRAAYERAQAR